MQKKILSSHPCKEDMFGFNISWKKDSRVSYFPKFDCFLEYTFFLRFTVRNNYEF